MPVVLYPASTTIGSLTFAGDKRLFVCVHTSAVIPGHLETAGVLAGIIVPGEYNRIFIVQR